MQYMYMYMCHTQSTEMVSPANSHFAKSVMSCDLKVPEPQSAVLQYATWPGDKDSVEGII